MQGLFSEQGQTNAAHRWRKRHDTRRVTASTTLSEVDDGKILNVRLAGADVQLRFPPAARCVGCVIYAVVTANPSNRALAITADDLTQLIVAGTSFAQGEASTLASVPVGTALVARCTGAHWHVQLNLSRATGPLNMGGNGVTNLAAPAAPNDAARKAYVDAGLATVAADAAAYVDAGLAAAADKALARYSIAQPQGLTAGEPLVLAWPILDSAAGPAITRSNTNDKFTITAAGRYLVTWTVTRAAGSDTLLSWLSVSSELEAGPNLVRGQFALAGPNGCGTGTYVAQFSVDDSFRVLALSDRTPTEAIPDDNSPLAETTMRLTITQL